MTTTIDTQQVFGVTIRRTYTHTHRANWSDVPEHTDSTHPEWGESAEAIVAKWAEVHANQSPYWLERFRDEGAHRPAPRRRGVPRRRGPPLRQRAVLRVRDRQACVCRVSFTCPDHGATCHGTHD